MEKLSIKNRVNFRLTERLKATEDLNLAEDTMIKKLALILSIVFIILTFIGAGYVFLNGGKVNAGYACIAMVFAWISISFYRKYK